MRQNESDVPYNLGRKYPFWLIRIFGDKRRNAAIVAIAIITWMCGFLWIYVFFTAFIFPPIVALIRGRHAMQYGIATNVIPVVVWFALRFDANNVGDRWVIFLAGVLIFFLFAAVITCLPIYFWQKRNAPDPECEDFLESD
jgi:CDP-diglyceride synthetase